VPPLFARGGFSLLGFAELEMKKDHHDVCLPYLNGVGLASSNGVRGLVVRTQPHVPYVEATTGALPTARAVSVEAIVSPLIDTDWKLVLELSSEQLKEIKDSQEDLYKTLVLVNVSGYSLGFVALLKFLSATL